MVKRHIAVAGSVAALSLFAAAWCAATTPSHAATGTMQDDN